jgi:SsrA-binding protein
VCEKIILNNRRAFYDFNILQEFEAGIVLEGAEVKSLRAGKASINDSFVYPRGSEMFIHHFRIQIYDKSSAFAHDPERVKKLLLRKTEINKLLGAVKKTGTTIVPLKIYFNKKNLVKLTIALVTGKKQHDKRQTIKERDWNRNKHKLLKGS